ncbi:MAG: hypothetical protein KKI08_15005 [Armatimonadetes bacterium]|nr:hypothetical protein [Armatimonadota bacterium]
MKPELTQQNREQLFFTYFMDCQTPQKPGGGPDQTWEIAELAVRGLYELFAESGLQHCLGFCAEPEVARRQSALLRKMAANGYWQALHFQVRGYRPPGATEDYDWQRSAAGGRDDHRGRRRPRGEVGPGVDAVQHGRVTRRGGPAQCLLIRQTAGAASCAADLTALFDQRRLE